MRSGNSDTRCFVGSCKCFFLSTFFTHPPSSSSFIHFHLLYFYALCRLESRKRKTSASVNLGDDDFVVNAKAVKSKQKPEKGPAVSDQEKLQKMKFELAAIHRKEADLRLKEKKLRQDIKKIRKKMNKAETPPTLVTSDRDGDVNTIITSMFVRQRKPSDINENNHSDLQNKMDQNESSKSKSTSLWTMAQQSDTFDEIAEAQIAKLDQLKNPSLKVLSQQSSSNIVNGGSSQMDDDEVFSQYIDSTEKKTEEQQKNSNDVKPKYDMQELERTLENSGIHLSREKLQQDDVEENEDGDDIVASLISNTKSSVESSETLNKLYEQLETFERELCIDVLETASPIGAEGILKELQMNFQGLLKLHGKPTTIDELFIGQVLAACSTARIVSNLNMKLLARARARSIQPNQSHIPANANNDGIIKYSPIDVTESPPDSAPEDCVLHYNPPEQEEQRHEPKANNVNKRGENVMSLILPEQRYDEAKAKAKETDAEAIAKALVYENMNPEEFFIMNSDVQPDFFALSEKKQLQVGAHLGLKPSANLPRILHDIWIRMNNSKTTSENNSKRSNTAAAASSKTTAATRKKVDKENRTNSMKSTAEVAEADKLSVFEFLKKCPDLYEKMVLFIPVEIDEIHVRLNSNGVKIGKTKLQALLDSENIFTTASNTSKSHKSLQGSKFGTWNK